MINEKLFYLTSKVTYINISKFINKKIHRWINIRDVKMYKVNESKFYEVTFMWYLMKYWCNAFDWEFDFFWFVVFFGLCIR